MSHWPGSEPTRLQRRLGILDAVVIGLGAMIGAGVFAAIGPAADVAGSGLLVGLAGAAVVAYCNATSSARLAARYPESGGTYVYGRERLGHIWGYLAGWGFVAGKVASCTAIALTFGAYATTGDAQRPLAVAAVVGLSAVNYVGVQKTSMLTRVIVAVVLASLACVVAAALVGGDPDPDRLGSLTAAGAHGILQAAGLMFFAFAGYARLATLGEEVVNPRVTIPRAIPLALVITLLVYLGVALSALLAVGPVRLAHAPEPLVAVVSDGDLDWLTPAVRVGATAATLGVLLSLLAGVSRTVFAMAANRDLPGWFDGVHPRYRTPHRAEVAVAALVVVVVLVADLREAIGFSAFLVLVYYGIANASAWTLGRARWGRFVAALGLAGCTTLAVNLPLGSVVGGCVVLMAGAAAFVVRASRSGSRPRGR